MIRFCPKCGTILRSVNCGPCNVTGESFSLLVERTPLELKGENSEVDSWIGPIEKTCGYCKTKNLYFKVEPPPSPDEPSVIKYKCKKCGGASSVYKN